MKYTWSSCQVSITGNNHCGIGIPELHDHECKMSIIAHSGLNKLIFREDFASILIKHNQLKDEKSVQHGQVYSDFQVKRTRVSARLAQLVRASAR